MEAVMRPRYSVLSAAWLREGIYHFCIVVEAHVNMNTPLHPLDKHMLAFFASIFRHYSLECPNSPSCLDLNHICAPPCICTCNNRMFVASASDFTVSSCNCEPLAWDYNHTLIILTPSQSSSKGTFLFLQRLWDRCWCVWFHLWNLFLPDATGVQYSHTLELFGDMLACKNCQHTSRTVWTMNARVIGCEQHHTNAFVFLMWVQIGWNAGIVWKFDTNWHLVTSVNTLKILLSTDTGYLMYVSSAYCNLVFQGLLCMISMRLMGSVPCVRDCPITEQRSLKLFDVWC